MFKKSIYQIYVSLFIILLMAVWWNTGFGEYSGVRATIVWLLIPLAFVSMFVWWMFQLSQPRSQPQIDNELRAKYRKNLHLGEADKDK
jgi:hypothetical protein